MSVSFIVKDTGVRVCPKTYLEVEAAAHEVSFGVAVLLALRPVEHVGEVAVEVRQEATLVVGVVTVGRIWPATGGDREG